MNEKKNIKIAISGDLGSGKSVLSKALSKTLGFEIISIGVIQRELALKYGMDALEFNKFMETHPEIDLKCDEMVREYGKEERGLILDSRLAWHFIPNSFKIHLLVDNKIAAKRIFEDNIRKNEKYSSLEDAEQKLFERKQSERLRYKTLYNVDVEDRDNYNCIVDTTEKTPQQIYNIVITQYTLWVNRE
ncbi:MAG: AAA family ATPase [Bacteroidales bacterium]|jgi:cytidylate kinase|nr:AAA family ATPase [Bacteroidales bacterium]